MKKIENLLLLPVAVLFFWSLGVKKSTLDIHLHDTYYVLEGASTLRILGGALLILLGMYKTIRSRHLSINQAFAVTHISVTSIILVVFFLLLPFANDVGNYLDYSNWNSYQNKMRWEVIAIISFLFIQAVFFLYFIFQMVKKPA